MGIFFLDESDLPSGASKSDAIKVVHALQGLGWEVQYGDGSPRWKEGVDPSEHGEFESELAGCISNI
ncbi:MAG: hypothetical protein B6242_00600 [Anaerolineaceae bacterium 4572_78]|nr:MAG: hypothetical protein B6242_00600 [Anaerolineaceae bacterium 4572_78]